MVLAVLPSIDELARLVAEAAQAELKPRFSDVSQQIKHDGTVLTEADLAMNGHLKEALAQRWPGIPFLSEEMSADEQGALLRDMQRPVWCVDPLDGTSNFAAGLPFYAVSLALIVDARPVIGLVYDPERDEWFGALKNEGAWLNGKALLAKRFGLPLCYTVALVDFKRLQPKLARVLASKAPYGSQRNLGACALEWVWIAAGRGHVYLHGGQKLWDRAAGALVLSEAGGYAATIDGRSLLEPALGSTAIVASSDPDLFAAWRSWVTETLRGKDDE
jgi:myo-inositol-1(or 4)-monophosphatase